MSKNSFKIDKSVVIKPGTEPASPEAGELYYNSSQNKFKQYDGTSWKDLGAGSGSGQINFITNPDGSSGTTGWTEGSFAAAARPSGTFTPSSGAGAFAISTTTTTPLGTGTTSFLLTKSAGASRQGRAVVSDFVLPLDYRAKVLKIDVNYIINSGTFVAGSNTTDSSLIWYAAFSTDNGATYTLAEPSSFKLLSNSTTISDRFSGSIQTPYNATNMRLIAYVAETANSAWVVECITSVSPSTYVYGVTITDWVAQTATYTNRGVTVSSDTFYTRRVGDSLEARGYFQVTGGTGSASELAVTIPNVTFDTAKLTATSTTILGQWFWYDDSGASSALDDSFGPVTYNTTNIISFRQPGNMANFATSVMATSDRFSYSFSVPILGWSSSVQMSDGYDGRVVAARVDGSATQSIANGSFVTVTTGLPTSATFDPTSSWDGTNKRFVIKSSGYYRVGYALRWPTNGNGSRAAALLIDGSGPFDLNLYQPSSVDSTYASLTSTLRYFTAGQTVGLIAYQTSGAALDITGTNLSIEKLSGSPTISAQETIGALYTGAPPTGTINGSLNIATFGTKKKDSHGAYSGGVYTIPTSGQYDIAAQVRIASAFNAVQNNVISIFIDGVNAYQKVIQATNGIQEMSPSIEVKSIPLLAGQQITIRVATDGPTPSYSSSAVSNFFSITRSGGY